MKIKQDFVTNSSSCSYIVCIPDVELFIKQIEKCYELTDDLKEIIRNSYGYMSFRDDIISLKDFYDNIFEIANNEGYIIAFDENGSENIPRFLNILFDQKQIDKVKKVLESV